MKFQELLEVLKKYKGDGTDYFLFTEQLGNHYTGKFFENADRYEIYSSELKKEVGIVVPNVRIKTINQNQKSKKLKTN